MRSSPLSTRKQFTVNDYAVGNCISPAECRNRDRGRGDEKPQANTGGPGSPNGLWGLRHHRSSGDGDDGGAEEPCQLEDQTSIQDTLHDDHDSRIISRTSAYADTREDFDYLCFHLVCSVFS